MKMEEFARPICDHRKIIIGKKTSERRKVQATSCNILQQSKQIDGEQKETGIFLCICYFQ